jgi:hypothetical protein
VLIGCLQPNEFCKIINEHWWRSNAGRIEKAQMVDQFEAIVFILSKTAVSQKEPDCRAQLDIAKANKVRTQ